MHVIQRNVYFNTGKKRARFGPMQEKSFIFVGGLSLRKKKKLKKFIAWGSAGIYLEKLIFLCGRRWGGYVEWIGLTQDRDRWRTLVSAVMNLRVS